MKKSDRKKILYFDCSSGISGDMILGAFIDLGVSLPVLKKELRKLKIGSFTIKERTMKKNGIRATKFDVHITESKRERNFGEIRRIIEKSSIDDDVKERSISIFKKMFAAEAKVHGMSMSRIHLHEMGAIDAIVDVVGSCIAFKKTGAQDVFCSPINVGSGFVRCDHGTFPVPAPATSELLRDIPIYSFGDAGELTTPTGAAIISSLASRFIPLPMIEIEKAGYGAGSRQLKSHPNILRVFLGTTEFALQKTVTIIETTIDDMNPQIFGHLMDTLFRGGALEVFSAHIMMKKNRPGILLTVISKDDDADRLIGIIFRETTTIGVRFRKEERHELERKIENVRTRFGTIRVKVSFFKGSISQVTPEYEDCVRIAQKMKIPLKDVQQEVISRYTGRQ